MISKIIKIFIISFIITIIFNFNTAAFNAEKKIIYELPRGSTLADAFEELEKISEDYYVYYFDPEVNLSIDFRLSARDETYESVLNLILYLNELKTTKISTQLYYVYPASKKSNIEDELKLEIPFVLLGTVQGKENVATIKYQDDIHNVKENKKFMDYLIKTVNNNHIIVEYKGKEYVRYINEGRYDNEE